MPWDLHLDLWLSFSSHKCITSCILIQALFNLIVANQGHFTILPLPLSFFFSGARASTFFLPLSTFFSFWDWWFRLIRHYLHHLAIVDKWALVDTSIYDHIEVEQSCSSQNNMINIHREYVTLHIICVRNKLDENSISFLNVNRCSTDQCDLVGVWMLHRSHPQGSN